ncbi:MAG: molecular chaperone DnaJ [Deltaproteobacteria bacterium]|nr:molecular chaperone DnaJ [Deltaproteobacteria bacterium]MCB9786060.1 molecular chaperone DnaJ [Deltaproteobacteria bacterium]
MAAKADYYEVLKVSRDADAVEIKRAYRSLAMQYHPDRNPGDAEAEERFKECAEAYQVLADADKRRLYDAYGHAGLQGEGGGSAGFEDIFSQFGDIFGDIFGGGGRGRRQAARGADLRYDLELSFEEAAFGVKREITFHRREQCEVCKGTGAEEGSKPERCTTCQGEGRVTRQQGFFMVQTSCPVCRGAGHTIKHRCKPCGGQGLATVERTVSVTIPPGVDTGVRLRVSGEGEAARQGGARGDLYVFVQVAAHEAFQRDGADVYSELKMSMSQAALGDEVEIATIHGPEKVKIPAGTQPGSVVRLRRKGVARLNGSGFGDHYLTLVLHVPEKLSREQKKLLAQLREEGL